MTDPLTRSDLAEGERGVEAQRIDSPPVVVGMLTPVEFEEIHQPTTAA